MAHPFVDPATYQPGSAARPVPKPRPADPPATPESPQFRAKLQRFDADGNPLSPTGEAMTTRDVAEAPRDETVMQGSQANWIRPPEGTEEGEELDETEDFTEDERQALAERKASKGGLEKALIHAQRKLGEQGTTMSALQQQLADVLAAQSASAHAMPVAPAPVVPEPDVAALQKEIDAIGESFLDDIPGNIKKLTKLQQDLAKATIAPLLKQKDHQAEVEAAQALMAEFPGLFSADQKIASAQAAYVDALATAYGAPTITNYRKALKDYAKERGWTNPGEHATPNAEVEAMKAAAATSAPAGAAVKHKGKIWRRAELQQLITKYPDKYRDLQPEIQRAYREGRVK